MIMKFLPPEAALRLLDLAQSKTPPPREITELKERIETATKAAEVASQKTGRINHIALKTIVQMKLELDALYGKWAQGELNDGSRIIIARK